MSLQSPYHALFDQSPTPVLILNTEGQVVDLNRQAGKALAVEAERLRGRPVLASVIPEDRARVKEIFLDVLGGEVREWTTRFKRGDGVTRVQRVKAVPLEGASGCEGILMFTRDLTESREGRPETFQLQTLLENLPGQFVVVLDRDGRIRYSSGLSRTHFRDDVATVGAAYQELLEDGAENLRRFTEMLHAVTEDGDHWGGTHWHRRVDGTPFPVQVFAAPYLNPRDGRVLGALLAGRDVGVEYDWRSRAERAERLAHIGGLVVSIAREVQDALGRMECELDSLDHRYGNGTGVTDRARARVFRLTSFVGALREFARDVRIARAAVSLDEAGREALARIEERAGAAAIRVVLESPDDLPQVHADVRHVGRVLDILLENAVESIEARDDGVHGGMVRITFTAGPESVVIHVADTGPGVDPQLRGRLFHPFFTTKSGRAGLGLSVARGLVEAHGGRMWMDAPADRTTVFSAEFPYRSPEAALRFRPVPLALTRTRSVLVVDDEDAVRRSIRRFLEKVGYEVREAWSGRSALAQITVGSPPELVITDLRMSDGSGYWFLEQLAEDFPDLLRRTVVVTGDTDHAEVSRLSRVTGCPVMRKPVELPDLLELLDEVALRN